MTNLTLPKGREGVQEAKAPVGGLGGQVPPRGLGAEPLSVGFSAARRGIIKCNFTAALQAGKERFFCLFQINQFYIFHIYFTMNFFYYMHIYTLNYCLVLRTVPLLFVRVIIINGVFGSP